VTSLKFGSPDMVHTVTGAFDFEREFYQNTDPTGFADTTRRHGDNYGGYVYDVVIHDRLARRIGTLRQELSFR
jgi:hypothetical protein